MPFVEVHWFEGRSDEQKAEIAKQIQKALEVVPASSPTTAGSSSPIRRAPTS